MVPLVIVVMEPLLVVAFAVLLGFRGASLDERLMPLLKLLGVTVKELLVFACEEWGGFVSRSERFYTDLDNMFYVQI